MAAELPFDPRAESLPTAPCWVDGEWITPSGAAVPVINPFTEAVIGECREADADLLVRAVRAATSAAASWRLISVEERTEVLVRAADLIEKSQDVLGPLVSREMGMPIALAKATQAQLPAQVLRSSAAAARSFPWAEQIEGATLVRRGAGVVGAITPWNMPVHQIVAKVSAAFAAGCSVVLKPSEQTPYDALVLAALFDEAGIPRGLFNVVTGTGPVTGAALAGQHGLARVSFTGSVAAGRAVAGLAAANLVPCTLELGGKSPAVILDDADLSVVVPSVLRSGFVNSGQACNATTRILVPSSRIEEVEELVRASLADFKMGDPLDPGTAQGPLVTRVQKQRVMGHLERAVADGGRVLSSGAQTPERGWFVAPTVVAGLSAEAAAVREEIFGPVLVLLPYADEEDAIRKANDSDYGLSAEVWSADRERAEAVAARLEVGQAKVNGVKTRERTGVPFGGVGLSGYGRELGAHGIQEMTEVTAVMS
ncbi:aldehyde dehydrogenase family protein [Streptomyces sp. NPDC127091]|uniref:aldehyde dehydrogenase family protein n=1 Tax=Streptomyces sp. NPDC127091 TaxID=3347134 RepID=UPI0036653FF6